MASRIKSQVSNYDWHFQYWDECYQSILPEYLALAEQTEKLLECAEKMLNQAEAIKINRREHAVWAKVGIQKSDRRYNDSTFKAIINKSIQDIVKLRKHFGIEEKFKTK